MKKIKLASIIIVMVVASIALIVQRFTYLDMTQARWFVEFWYLFFGWFAILVVSMYLYLMNR